MSLHCAEEMPASGGAGPVTWPGRMFWRMRIGVTAPASTFAGGGSPDGRVNP
jgi:hypothetical protein